MKTLSFRSTQDYHVYKQIIEGEQEILIPNMPDIQKDFWALVIDRMHPTKDCVMKVSDYPLVEYAKDRSACVAYSHGLESSTIKYMWPHLPMFSFSNYADKFEWLNPIEMVIAIIGAGRGYNVTFYGDELEEGDTFREFNYRPEGFYWTTSKEFTTAWKNYSGCDFLSPFSLMRKSEVFNIAKREGVNFVSCYNSTTEWCGKCFKCHQIHKFYTHSQYTAPFTIQDVNKCMKDWSDEDKLAYNKIIG